MLLKSTSYSLATLSVGSRHFSRSSSLSLSIKHPSSPPLQPRLVLNKHTLTVLHLRRISQGPNNNSSSPSKDKPIPLLKDINQPFVFDISLKSTPYRFHLYDTASPESWTLLTPHVVILCYDISSRLSLINVQRLVRHPLLLIPLITNKSHPSIIPSKNTMK